MALAIFWLPLIAGLLLGGLAAAAWYGGDKTLAVWVGFIGAVCLLLTAALQVQQYVWSVANQPHLALVPSEQQWFLRWDPPNSYQMQINNDPNPVYGAWKVPTFQIRNTGTVAQDASIKWAVTPFQVDALIASSTRLKDQKVEVKSNEVRLAPQSGPGIAFLHPMEWSNTITLPFITRETTTFIPLSVWENAALFFIATLPDAPEAKSEPFFFEAQINWNIPEGGQPKRFRVKAVAKNAKLAGVSAPNFLSTIEFEVSDDN